jgi:hypothetical protein
MNTAEKIREAMGNVTGPIDPEHEKAMYRVIELTGEANVKAAAVAKLKNSAPTSHVAKDLVQAQQESDTAEALLKEAEDELTKFPK